MRFAVLALTAAALMLGAAAPPAIDPLPRAVVFGVGGDPEPAGLRVGRLGAGLTAERLGVRLGDIIAEANGAKITDTPSLAKVVAGLRAGDPVRITVLRGGEPLRLSGRALEKPRETFRNGVARYGAVPFRGGLLREIMVTPGGGPAPGPVVFLLQGYTCAAVETSTPDSPHRLLIDGLLARGISTYRTEKPQVGDSRGGPSCTDADFATEMAGFEAGYDALVNRHGVPPERVFLLGHSMGGVEAPLLAAKRPPRGVAVYGTVLRNWHDYLLDVFRVQGFRSEGEDPAEGAARLEGLRGVLHAVYVQRRPLRAIAADPAAAARLREIGWDGAEHIMGRHAGFWQGLAATRSTAAWRDTRSEVLAVFGESDIAAVHDQDHRTIAEIANHYRPGTGRFVSVPRTGHGMELEGDLEAVRRRNRAGPGAGGPEPAFNPEIVDIFADWIEAAMTRPPAAERFPATTAAAREGGPA